MGKRGRAQGTHTGEEAGRERKKEKEKAKSPPVASRPLSTHDVQFFSLSQNWTESGELFKHFLKRARLFFIRILIFFFLLRKVNIHVETWRSSALRDFVLIFGLTTFNRTPGSLCSRWGDIRHSLSLLRKNRFSSLVRVCPVRFTRKTISRKPRRPSGMLKIWVTLSSSSCCIESDEGNRSISRATYLVQPPKDSMTQSPQ